MTTISHNQYDTDEKAENYEKYKKENQLVKKMQIPSIRKIFNNSLVGKRVIDLGCGSGGSTRILADLNPDELIGVDLSPQMIDVATKLAVSSANKIKYLVRDCSQPIGLGQFDLVFSLHLLTHASTKDILLNMIKCMFDSTKAGGLCAGIMVNPFSLEEHFPKWYKYGLEYARKSSHELVVKLYDGDVRDGKFLIELNDFNWPPELYAEYFQASGFENFQWINLSLGDEFTASRNDRDFFQDVLDHPITIMFKATRPEIF
jgi:SAM-dependent methyltransferase